MDFDTKSERLFAAACQRHGYVVQKLPTRAERGLKTADFSIGTPHGRILAEVEELTPNDDDLRQIREGREGKDVVGGTTIGSRAREAIRDAAAQLKAHRDEGIPMIVVLYDNVRTVDGRVAYPMLHVQPPDLDAAMYGNRVVHVSLSKGAFPRPDRSGGGRTMTRDEKNYISAVVVLSDADDESLLVYHNCFAEVPLPTCIFTDDRCRHFQKGPAPHDDPWQWYPVEL